MGAGSFDEADSGNILFERADVAHGRDHAPTGSQESLNLLTLGRRFNDENIH